MPTYEYVCDACGHEFEEYQSITADALTKCPECKKKKLRRVIGTGAAIIFKGSGFYQTDYRSDSYKKAAKADTSSSSSSSGSSESTSSSSSSDASSSSSTKSESSSPAKSDAPSKPSKSSDSKSK